MKKSISHKEIEEDKDYKKKLEELSSHLETLDEEIEDKSRVGVISNFRVETIYNLNGEESEKLIVEYLGSGVYRDRKGQPPRIELDSGDNILKKKVSFIGDENKINSLIELLESNGEIIERKF